MRIYLLTNGTLFDEKGWLRLQGIQHARIWLNVSLDAGPNTYEKLRRGGIFETLLENLTFIGQLRKNGILERFILNVTVQKDNFESCRWSPNSRGTLAPIR